MIKVSQTTAEIINFKKLIKVPHIYFDNFENKWCFMSNAKCDLKNKNLALEFTRKLNKDIKPFKHRTKRGG